MRYLSIVFLRIIIFIFILTVSNFSIIKTSVVTANSPTNITIDVHNAETRDVLSGLADVGEVNMVIDDSVTGTITLKLKDVSFETALDLITKLKGLAYYKQGNIIVVADSAHLASSYGEIHFFRLNYADAQEAVYVLSLISDDKKQLGATTPAASSANTVTEIKITTDSILNSNTEKTGSLSISSNSAAKQAQDIDTNRFKVDVPTNTIIFKGTSAESEQIRRVLVEIDVPYKQVSLEAQVVALTKESSKSLGVEWTWDETPQIAGDSSNKGAISYGRSPQGLPYQFYYQAKINALVSKGEAKVLAKPKITTLNRQQAKILIGDRVPVLVEKNNYGSVTTNIEYIDTGIKLTFIPNINTDSSITAIVHTEVSSPIMVSEMKAYRITTREAETIVRMQNGETMVIGGLIGSIDSETRKSIPFLSSLPLIGNLFKNTTISKTDTEVVIFLTANIVE